MNKSGAALIITLWITAILSTIALTAAYFSRTDLKMANYQAKSLEAYALAHGGMELAIAKLLADNESWRVGNEDLELLEIEPGMLEVDTTDETAKINLNMDNFYNLFSFLQFLPRWKEYEEINILLDSLKDWRDEDSDEELNGAEDPYYLSLPNPYLCKDGKLDIPEEILLIKGMNPELFSLDYFTVFGNGKININTVSEDILYAVLEGQAIPGAETITAIILAHRRGDDGEDGTDDDQPFKDTASPLLPSEIQDFFTVSSRLYRISSTAKLKNCPVTKKIEVILDGESRPAKILYWREK